MITPEELARIPDAKPGVQYKRHPVYIYYIVSSDGNVYSTTDKRGLAERTIRKVSLKLKGIPDPDGYLRVSMRLNGILKPQAIHWMVLESFCGPRPSPDHEGAHGNGIRNDNRLGNLRWATIRSNADDKIKHGSHKGRRNSAVKLFPHHVLEILNFQRYKGSAIFLAKKYGVSKFLISKIRARGCWKHLPFP